MELDTTKAGLAHRTEDDFPKNGILSLRINPNRKVAFYVYAFILYCLFLMSAFGQQPLREHLEKSSEAKMVEELLPTMRKLAQEGKPAAAVWLLKHDYDAAKQSGFSDLSEAALKGDPESMFNYGVLQYDLERYLVGRVWIEKAAAEGHPSAVRFLQYSDDSSL